MLWPHCCCAHPAANQTCMLTAFCRLLMCHSCADAMAEALGVADLHKGLRGSLLYDAAPEPTVQAARAALKGALKAAWSQEALR